MHAGPVGAGTAMKLARNLIHFVSFTAVTEAQRLAEAAGVDLQALGEVVRHTDAITGGPGAIMHRETAAPLAPDDPWRAIFDHVRALGEKDLRFAAEPRPSSSPSRHRWHGWRTSGSGPAWA